MSKQARLRVLPSGKLIYYKPEDVFPNYPLLSPTPYWPKVCHNDSLILQAPRLNSISPLLRLPDDVLQPILQSVVMPPLEFSIGNEAYWDLHRGEDEDENLDISTPTRGWFRYEAAYRLIWVCKRFHALVLPFMYRNVSLDVTIHWLDCPPQEKLFRDEILRRPLLQNYIKHLAVCRQSFHSPIVKLACVLPCIRKLSLKSVSESSEIEPSLIGPTRDQSRTAEFTRIQFHNLHARPESVRRFLEWPKELHEFVINDLTYDGYNWAHNEPDPSYRWNPRALVDALSPQKDHLRVLDLGWLGYDNNQNTLQVSAFPNLQSLALGVAYENPREKACRNWLTPSLRTLVLDIHYNDSQGGPGCYNSMSNFRVDAFVSFAKMAREWSEQSGRTVGLRRIGIRAYSRGDDAWRREDEVSCLHGEWGEKVKTNLIRCLKEIEKYGFEAFWIGYSGHQYTSKMMEAMCRCKNR